MRSLTQGADRLRHAGVLRGGSWNNNDNNCRAANRNYNNPQNTNDNNGFRVSSSWPMDPGEKSGAQGLPACARQLQIGSCPTARVSCAGRRQP